MSYVSPDTNVLLCAGVPIDNSYNHSLFFTSRTAQFAYFSSKAVRTLLNQSYQRTFKNKIRVGVCADDIITCNYLCFQNHAFGDKWFYAFINQIDYINNQTSEITYEIDVLQTWLADYQLKSCYVLREHSYSDNIGDNIVPEPVELGEYVGNGTYNALAIDTYYVAMMVNKTPDGQSVLLESINHIFNGARIYAYDTRDLSAITSFINKYLNSPDSILAMYMVPGFLFTGATFVANGPAADIAHTYPGGELSSFAGYIDVDTSINGVTPGYSDLDGYTPKNNKMYTYPYTLLNVGFSNGQSMNLRYEFFNNQADIHLVVSGSFVQPVSITVYPVRYKGSGGPNNAGGATWGININESITLSNYPASAWTTDYYQAWMAQNAVPGIIQGATSIGMGAMAGGIYGALAAGVGVAANALSAHYEASIHADITKGNLQCGNSMILNNLDNIYYTRMTLNHSNARIIDDFFTMYGYAVNARKVPTITNRPHWNYIKTNGCIISGSIPSDDEAKIISIYDNGVTFWKSPAEVGNYMLDNSPA